MPGKKPRAILPAAIKSSQLSMDSRGLSRKLQAISRPPNVACACFHCRKARVKCSGTKPRCARCLTRKLECDYDDDDIAQLSLSNLRKHYREVLRTNKNFQALISRLMQLPEIEAVAILRQIRATNNLRAFRDLLEYGDLLIQQGAPIVVGNEREELRLIEQQALAESPFEVPAMPWTTIAGDGIISKLVSSFITLEYTFLFSFIDRNAFLEDMRHGDPATAKHCSRLLVSAICSLRSHTCNRAKQYSQVNGMKMHEAFFNEAKELFDLEAGKLSIPTAQALVIMYMCCVGMGKDRVGKMFRTLAYDMLKQLQLNQEHKLAALRHDNPEYQKCSDIRSRVYWGIYCFDSISSFAYLRPSLIIRPSLPRTFLQRPIESLLQKQPITSDELRSNLIMDAACDLSIIYNEYMSYNLARRHDQGNGSDLHRRSQFLSRVRLWRIGLAEELNFATNPTMAIYCLRSYEDQVVLSIIRNIDENTNLPNTDLLIGDVAISCCLRTIDGLNRFRDECRAGLYSSHVIYTLYHSSLTLLTQMQHSSCDEFFTNICRQLSLLAKDFSFIAFLMQGIRILADKMHISIPDHAMPYFKSLRFSDAELCDVPISFVIFSHDEVYERVLEDEASKSPLLELGPLITKWNQSSTALRVESTEIER